MSNFTKMVEARQAKTGESWATAAAQVRAQGASKQKPAGATFETGEEKWSISSIPLDADRFEASLTKSVINAHLVRYFSVTEKERVEFLEEMERCERTNTRSMGEGYPVGEWNMKWPDQARAAVLALWRVPREG